MQIRLITHTPLSNSVIGGRTCWSSFHKGGCYPTPTDEITDEDKAFLTRTIKHHKHGSIAEHMVYTFYISDVSRALLQELARHRLASPSVKSSRYTLKALKDELPFYDEDTDFSDYTRAVKYIKLTGNHIVDDLSIKALEGLRFAVLRGISNDLTKYCLPECFLTELTWTINSRSLSNFLSLRSSPAALWEIRDLSKAIFDSLPESHKFLYDEYFIGDSHVV